MNELVVDDVRNDNAEDDDEIVEKDIDHNAEDESRKDELLM